MSEKKTTSKKVHTLTLEDQTKLAQANVKKMEQGKIEVMKVVEGVQGAEKLAELIERGKKTASSHPVSSWMCWRTWIWRATRWTRSTIPWRTWASTPWAMTICPSWPMISCPPGGAQRD